MPLPLRPLFQFPTLCDSTRLGHRKATARPNPSPPSALHTVSNGTPHEVGLRLHLRSAAPPLGENLVEGFEAPREYCPFRPGLVLIVKPDAEDALVLAGVGPPPRHPSVGGDEVLELAETCPPVLIQQGLAG